MYASSLKGWMVALAFGMALATTGCSGRHAATGGDGGVLEFPDAGPPSDAGPVTGATLRIDPASADLSIVDERPATLDYHATLVATDGTETDVTSQTTFTSSDTGLGSFAGATFTTALRSGQLRVFAMARGLMASGDVTIRTETDFFASGVGPDARGDFGGADDPAHAPQIVYPADGVMVPPNLNEVEIHFLPAGGSLFEVHFQTTAIDVRVYTGCDAVGSGCVYTLDDAVWTALTTGALPAEPITYEVLGVDGGSPGGVGTSARQKLFLADDPITGGLYYWNAAAGSIYRYDFGLRGQHAELYMNAASAGASTCVGCHVLSRDGSRIAVGMDLPAPSPYAVFDTGTRANVYRQGTMFGGGSNFFSFSPDATQIMASNGIDIVLRDAATGMAITDPLVADGTMPDWSPDGMHMVYAKSATMPPCFGGFCGATGVGGASLETMDFDGTSWAAGATLVPAGSVNNYYPTFSPDGQWVLFDRSPSNHDSYDSPDAELWIVSAAGGDPVRLDDTTSDAGDSWPKWDPTVYMVQGHPLMWMTFSSRRAFGVRLTAGSGPSSGWPPSIRQRRGPRWPTRPSACPSRTSPAATTSASG